MKKKVSEEFLVSIKTAAVKTGLSQFVIRAWEKRYKAVSPARNASNRRLYSSRDIQKLNCLRFLVDHGYSIGRVAGAPYEQLREMCDEFHSSGKSNVSCSYAESEKIILRLMKSAHYLDHDDFLKTLGLSFNTFDLKEVIKRILIPYLSLVGERWAHGELEIYKEHFSTELLKGFLFEKITSLKVQDSARTLIFAAPERQNHTLSLLIAALTAGYYGHRSIFMGGNLPVEELSKVMAGDDIQGCVIALVYPSDDSELKDRLGKLVADIPVNKKIFFIGGSAAYYIREPMKERVFLSRDYDSFTEVLMSF